MTRRTPPTPPPDDDLIFRLLGGGLRLVGAGLRYLVGRAVRTPLVGLLYLAVALPAALLLVQHGRLAFAVATAMPYTRPTPVFPLSVPLPDPVPLLLAGLVGLVVGFDRWVAWRTRARPSSAPASAPPAPEVCVLGRAYRRAWDPEQNTFTLTPDALFPLTVEHLRTHLLVVAPQGGGKTSSILLPLFSLGRRLGAAVFVFDAKGDGQDWSPGGFDLTFAVTAPATSMRLDVWSGRTPRQAGERLGEALVDRDSPPYFVNSAKDALAGLVAAHHRAYSRMPSLRQLLLYLRAGDAREDLRADLRRAGLPDHSDEVADLARVALLAEGKHDVLGNLDTALTPLARGDLATILATDGTGYRVEQLLRHGVRVRFVLPVADYPRLAPILGRLVLAQFTDAVLSPWCNQTLPKLVIVDEAHNFVTPTIAKGMAMARSNRGCYILALQNLNQITDPTLREDLLSVAGNKIVMAGVGDYDSTKFSALFGAVEREYLSTSTSQGLGTHVGRSTGRGQHGGGLLGSTSGAHYQLGRTTSSTKSETAGTSRQVRLRPTFLPTEIRELPRYHAIVERRDNSGEVTPATVVHLDRDLVLALQEEQRYALYYQTGQPDGPRTLPPLPPVFTAPLAWAADNRTGEEDSLRAERADEGDGRTAPTSLPADTPEQEETSGAGQMEEGKTPLERTPSAMLEPSNAPVWTTRMVQQIVDQLQLDVRIATALVARADGNGRDAAYLTDLLAYVRDNPKVRAPAVVFRRLVETNMERRPISGTPTPIADREDSA